MTAVHERSARQRASGGSDFDVVIVGAGFSGLYMLHRLRDGLGLSVRVYEAGDGVGGTWYWNRYPGARCDVESVYYSYSFSPELEQEWEWTRRYPEQPEVLSYLNYVADKFGLRRDIEFATRVVFAAFDEVANRWEVRTADGDRVTARFLITAVGCLSAPNVPAFPGLETFTGDWYHTGRWPHEGVSLAGKRVGVIGTGSSGIQAIPVIAREADSVTVFQRTPNYTIPARDSGLDPVAVREIKANYPAIRQQARLSCAGMVIENKRSALEATKQERQAIFEAGWQKGGFYILYSFGDLLVSKEANESAAAFIRSKISQIVSDPRVADKLSPKDHPYGTKRPPIDSGYYETYNRSNIALVDVRESPIQEITPKGVRTQHAGYEFDTLVLATGFDAMTGSLMKMDIRGRHGMPLREKWKEGPISYLGLQTAGFPNLFTITGPYSPSVLSNMVVSIEQHVDWIADCIAYLGEHGLRCIEASPSAENDWVAHAREVVSATLYPLANSWYVGANIPGKQRVFMPYAGGVGPYRQICDEIAAKNYKGFAMA